MKRIIYGLVALFFALLLLQASSYGTIGHFVAHTTHNLIGAAGVAVLEVILLGIAFTLLVPRAVRRWLFALPAAVAKLSADPLPARAEAPRASRRLAAPRQQIIVVTGAELQGAGLRALLASAQGYQPTAADIAADAYAARGVTLEEQAAHQARMYAAQLGPQHSARWEQMAPTAVAPDTVMAPAARRRLDDVRGALKELGYKSYEYEPLVAAMDPSDQFETLVRVALKQLQKASA